MQDVWRHAIAEFVGTFALVFIGGAAIMTGQSLVAVALAHGLILAVMVTAVMRIAGHFNPAVTLAFMLVRRLDPPMAAVYILVQLLASMAAAYTLSVAIPAQASPDAAMLGGQSLASGVSTGQGIVLEVVATMFLTFVIFGTAVDTQSPRVGGFAIGLVVAANILAVGPLTGASFNPARSFGPAVASGNFTDHAVYWIGPILGAVIGALLYERVLLRHPVEPEEHGALRPEA